MSEQYNYDNSSDYGNEIVDTTLDAIRDLEDLDQDQTLRGTIVFNPSGFQVLDKPQWQSRAFIERREQVVTQERRFMVLGPYLFAKKFAVPPEITFGEKADFIAGVQEASVPVGIPVTYVPFTCQAQIFRWNFANGEVDGFYLGLYALTSPPKGATSHTISWIASGQASRYADQGIAESWSESYDYNEPDYIEDYTGDFE
jgi:hypothetical protein